MPLNMAETTPGTIIKAPVAQIREQHRMSPRQTTPARLNPQIAQNQARQEVINRHSGLQSSQEMERERGRVEARSDQITTPITKSSNYKWDQQETCVEQWSLERSCNSLPEFSCSAGSKDETNSPGEFIFNSKGRDRSVYSRLTTYSTTSNRRGKEHKECDQ